MKNLKNKDTETDTSSKTKSNDEKTLLEPLSVMKKRQFR